MPKQERAERTRLAILDAAAVEFDEYGYEGARLDRIIERTGSTKGAVYFHFRSKIDIAKALVEQKYTNWPVIVAKVTGSGLRGLAAAEELTLRVGDVFVTDVRVRAAMKLSQTVLPPIPSDNSYDRWIELIAVFIGQELGEDNDLEAQTKEIATVAVHSFFGSYMIAHEYGRLAALRADVARMWRVVALAVRDLTDVSANAG